MLCVILEGDEMSMIIGNAIVGQSGGPTSAINATLFGVMRACYENKKVIKSLYGMKNGIEGLLKEDFVDLFSFFDKENPPSSLKSTPACALGSCRIRLPSDENDKMYKRIFDILEKYDIKYFFYIGGNDSMDTVNRLSSYAKSHNHRIRLIGIPKTIDNDLALTDFSPGYGSCAKFVATIVRELLRDCAIYTQRAVTIIEVMGRDAGWIGLASAMADITSGGIDLLYIPYGCYFMYMVFICMTFMFTCMIFMKFFIMIFRTFLIFCYGLPISFFLKL